MNKCCGAFLIWLALLSVGVAGCVTHELDEKIRNDASYTEEVKSVLISEDGKKLVFIGNGYHYVFDAPVGLSRSLYSSFRKSLFAKFKEFRVDKNGFVVGNIIITLDDSASQQDKEEAIKIGYEKRSVNPALELSLQGKRYKSGSVASDRAEYKLNYTYKVTVLEERSSAEKAALTAATPIAVLADGVLVIVGVPLVILLKVSPN